MARSEATDATSPSTALSRQERKSLADRETVIEQGLHTFVEVGNALTEIRDKHLYRDPENPKRTFADYCRERWDMSKTHANRLVDASAIIEHLTPIGVIPATESQCRPLTTIRTEDEDDNKVIDLEVVGEVWQVVLDEAPEKNGKPVITAARVEEAVAKRFPKTPKAEAPFDYDKARMRVVDWVRVRIRQWPPRHRDALSQILQHLSKEAQP